MRLHAQLPRFDALRAGLHLLHARRRPPVHLVSAVFALLLAACQIPQSRPAGATPPAPTATETPAPIVIPTRTPGPAPTATPAPLAEPDRALAATLSAKGRSLFVTSDLNGAEAAFIDAISADPSYLPAHLGLTDVYLYQSQYWQQALQSAQNAIALAPEDSTVLALPRLGQAGRPPLRRSQRDWNSGGRSGCGKPNRVHGPGRHPSQHV